MPAKRQILIRVGLIFHLVSLANGPHAVFAQVSHDREIQKLPATLAIAEFLNGRFLLVGFDGRIRMFDLRPDNSFTLARFSPDGRLIVGLSGRTIMVLNERFERIWQRNTSALNIISLALSQDGTRVAFLTNGLPSRPARLEITTAEGPDEIIESVALAERDTLDHGLSWDPKGERVAFGAGGKIAIVDVKIKTSVTAAAGDYPSWSPDGQWISYRSSEGRLMLLDVKIGTPQATGLRPDAGAHWSPDSDYIFINEDYSARAPASGCVTNTRFVVYRLSDKARKIVYDPCGLRDANFGWISDAAEWARAAATRAPATGDK